MVYTIKKKFKFEAAHRLQNTKSICCNLHGHSYKVSVEIKYNDLNGEGMVIDFNDLKPFQRFIDDYIDHAVIISESDGELLTTMMKLKTKLIVIPFKHTTAENIACYLHKQFSNMFPKFAASTIIGVYETENNFASYM